jgi:hypothetical protein
MKKLIFCLAILFSVKAFAQPRSGTVEYDKQQVPCYIYDVNFSKDVAEDAIKDKFKQMGVNGTDKKGFMEFRNAIVPDISSTPVDVLIKVVKKDKSSSTINMIVSRPVGATDTSLPPAEGSTAFLNNLNTTTTDYSLELDIKKQADALKSAQKKYTNLTDDGNSLQKKLKNVQDDIADNAKKQAAQSEEVKKQQAIYDQMVARRRVGAPVKN